MNIVKSLHASLLHRSFGVRDKNYFCASVLWGFNLQTGEPVLEQDLWSSVGDMIGKNELFDAGLPKPYGEFLVHGSCYAADGVPVSASRVSISLGQSTKQLYVFGDRHWIKAMGVGWGLSDPEPFTEMSINYSNAFGGKDYTVNPLGKGIDEIEDIDGPKIFVPNVEFEDELIGSPKDRPRPASLNRTDLMSESRLNYGGTYDQHYIENKMPGFPDDFDYRFFNDAAEDQWIGGYFDNDEPFEIRNMHPERSVIKGRLPGVIGRVFIEHEVAGLLHFSEIPTQLDTVWFFPAADIAVMIHRGTIEVSEDDATDVKKILIANENLIDTPRDIGHYKEEMRLRTDPDEAFKYILNSTPLIPLGATCGFKIVQQSSDFPLEMIASKNMNNFSEIKKLEADQATEKMIMDLKKQLEDNGVDGNKIEHLIQQIISKKENPEALTPEMLQIELLTEKVMPGVKDNPQDFDLSKINLKAMDELKEYLENLQVEKTQEAKNKLLAQMDELVKMDEPGTEAVVAQLQGMIDEMDKAPVLPRIDKEALLAQFRGQCDEMEKQLLTMASMGVPQEKLVEIESAFDFDALQEQAQEGLEQAHAAYRASAHHIESARSPHEGHESEIRDRLIRNHKSQAVTANGDYAFVDLSDLDLSGINLSGSYLEFANLTNTDLSHANLSKAILCHANLTNANLSNANLVDANLGSAHIEGAQFSDSDFSGSTLSKSNLSRSTFLRCNMAEKNDMFLDTVFDRVEFIDSDLKKGVFIDADISGCNFSGSDLSESSFLNPVMNHANFEGATLNSVTFAGAEANSTRFNKAKMKNVRFVGESSLQGADFSAAQVEEANLRDCNLQQSKFVGTILNKTDFGGSNLTNAVLDKSEARQVQFIKSNLGFASLNKTDLMEASMYKATLTGTSFVGSNLYSVNFLGCTIGETDFSSANLDQTIFKDWRPS